MTTKEHPEMTTIAEPVTFTPVAESDLVDFHTEGEHADTAFVVVDKRTGNTTRLGIADAYFLTSQVQEAVFRLADPPVPAGDGAPYTGTCPWWCSTKHGLFPASIDCHSLDVGETIWMTRPHEWGRDFETGKTFIPGVSVQVTQDLDHDTGEPGPLVRAWLEPYDEWINMEPAEAVHLARQLLKAVAIARRTQASGKVLVGSCR